MRCDYFIDDIYLGAGSSNFAESLAFYCPECGNIWARAAVAAAPWFHLRRWCRDCWHNRPDLANIVEDYGPIIFDPRKNPSLYPTQLLVRDFLILMEIHNDRTETPT